MKNTIGVMELIQNLHSNEFFLIDGVSYSKLCNITTDYIDNNPIRIGYYDGKYTIIDGRHRLFMAMFWGYDKIPIEVVK